MGMNYVLSIDQGTTGTKIILLNQQGQIHASSYQKHIQYYPKSGWAENDPEEIWEKILDGVKEILNKGGVNPVNIKAVGIANQGETVMFWDSISGMPLHPAILWSCRRSEKIAEKWKQDTNWSQKITEKTGLLIDPYFSATKIRWMMENIPLVQETINLNRARCSTLDSWIIWKLTGGSSYATDASTAARTLLYDIYNDKWDQEILDYLEIKSEWLPSIHSTVSDFGITNPHKFCGIEAPIKVSMVDQPAALYGHLCIEPGTSKCTYGTGCFVYMNVGESAQKNSDNNLMTTIVWKKDGIATYALDGAVYSAGSAIEWGKNSLKLYKSIDELQEWSKAWYENLIDPDLLTNIKEQVWFIPSLSGIAAPYWKSSLRGGFLGLSHKTSNKDLARSILEGIAHRVADVLEEMNMISSTPLKYLKVDGGLTNNPYLMQFQADLLGIPVEVPSTLETTAVGVGYLLGESLGWWNPRMLEESNLVQTRIYHPRLNSTQRELIRMEWKKVIFLLSNLYQKENNVLTSPV
jgi:glycerol kinase